MFAGPLLRPSSPALRRRPVLGLVQGAGVGIQSRELGRFCSPRNCPGLRTGCSQRTRRFSRRRGRRHSVGTWGFSLTPQPEARGREGTGPLEAPPPTPAAPAAGSQGGPARQVARHVAGVKALSTCAGTVWTPADTREPSPLPTGVCLEPEGPPAAPRPSWSFAHESSMKFRQSMRLYCG